MKYTVPQLCSENAVVVLGLNIYTYVERADNSAAANLDVMHGLVAELCHYKFPIK